MDFYKRVLILTGVENKNFSGVIKLNSIENGVDVVYNIIAPANDYTLLLKENDTLYTASITNGKGNIEINGMKNNNVVLCNLLSNENIVMYGATNGNKISAFALNDEYKKKKIKKTPLNVNFNKNTTKSAKVMQNENNASLEKKQEKIVEKKVKNIAKKPDSKTENSKVKTDKNGVKIPTEEEILSGENIEDALKKNYLNNTESKNIQEENEILKKKIEEDQSESIKEIENFSDNIIEELFDENLIYKGENFYQSIHNQLDEMFICYPEETNLQQIMPNSKWIRVDYEKDEYYVVGLITENENVKYICYGIPSKYSIKPPKEVINIAEWLPLDINKPRDVGYWIIYQDGKTGKTLQKN